jgi:hypothetical protein
MCKLARRIISSKKRQAEKRPLGRSEKNACGIN